MFYELVWIDNFLSVETISKPRQIWWKIRPHIDFGTIEFRICDVQRSLKNVEMITAICQALVYQASKDLENKCLSESFNMEYLNDGLWKATRFPIQAKMIDPETNTVSTIAHQVNKMKNEVTVIHTAYEDGPKAVATVDVGPSLSGMGALEYAFRATQNSTEKLTPTSPNPRSSQSGG